MSLKRETPKILADETVDEMKKIYITNPYQVEIRDVEIPTPGPGEILVKTDLSGISIGTEMMLYRGTYPNFQLKKWPQWQDYPVCPGYELAGTVVAIGESVSAGESEKKQVDSLGPTSQVLTASSDEFNVGDRVICMGEHGEYAVVPVALAAKIPDQMSYEESTLAILATTTMHAIRRAEIEYGDTVAIIGVGIVGYLAVQHAKLAGARRVVVVDVNNDRLAVASKCGADYTINPSETDPVQALLAFNGIGADVAIEASGAAGTEQLALELIRDRGKVVILGWHTENLNYSFGDFYFKEAKLIATRAIGPEAGIPYAYVRWASDQSLRWAVDLISQGKITGKHFTPLKLPYTDIKKAYEMIDTRDKRVGMQVILEW